MTHTDSRIGAQRRQNILGVVVVVAVAAVLAPVLVPLVAPWSNINRRHEEINITTGQVRVTRYVWFVKVSETTGDTPLSLALQGDAVNAAPIEPWHPACTTSPPLVRHSPHYAFHGALYQAHEAGVVFDRMPASSDDAKKETARRILTLWQTGGNYHAAGEYIFGLLTGETE